MIRVLTLRPVTNYNGRRYEPEGTVIYCRDEAEARHLLMLEAVCLAPGETISDAPLPTLELKLDRSSTEEPPR